MSTESTIPDEFSKVIKDFVSDVGTTFPEYLPLIKKWWKPSSAFDHIENSEEREIAFNKAQESSLKFIYKFCLKKYPPHFFEILYQNNEMFLEDSEIDTEFLPFIHFKHLWQDDISDSTRETIWKYLQLILFSIVGTLDNREAFGDNAKMFDSLDEDDFKGKLEEALDQIKGVFDQKGNTSETGNNMPQPNAEELHDHLSGMFTGKLGSLAREIAEETAGELNLDMEGETDVKGVFQKMFKNPGKLMGLVQNVGNKLESKMKNGDIKESELMKEASEMMTKMKDMPGMGDIQSMMSKMGLNTKGAKVDLKGMQAKMERDMKSAKMRERMKEKAEANRIAKEMAAAMPAVALAPEPKYSEEELLSMFGESEKATPKKKKSKSKNKAKGKK